jgi:signal transduction histidine kinase
VAAAGPVGAPGERLKKKTDNRPSRPEPWVPGFAFRQRPDLSFDRISPEVEEWTGVPAERWQREKELFLRLVESPEQVKQQIEASAKSPEGVMHFFRLRHDRTGRVASIAECRRGVLDKNGRVLAYEGFWLDLTRLALAEKRLAAASWKEALSAVTMGVAHDFNNALTGILSLSEFFLSQTDAQHPFHEGLGIIKQNTHQAARLAHQLMRLHHDQPGKRDYRDLNTLASDLMDLLRRVIPKRIALTSQWAAGPLPVEVDAVEFQRVVLYLAQNAAEAIADRGEIRLETSFHREPPTLRHWVGVRPGVPSACLAVVDNGVGIPADNLRHVFEPFFTTKPPDRGAGLGLHHARLFAEQHGGGISVDSREGQGSTFRVWLPFVVLE